MTMAAAVISTRPSEIPFPCGFKPAISCAHTTPSTASLGILLSFYANAKGAPLFCLSSLEVESWVRASAVPNFFPISAIFSL